MIEVNGWQRGAQWEYCHYHAHFSTAGWYSNGMKESHFLGGEMEKETTALPHERVSKRGRHAKKRRNTRR